MSVESTFDTGESTMKEESIIKGSNEGIKMRMQVLMPFTMPTDIILL